MAIGTTCEALQFARQADEEIARVINYSDELERLVSTPDVNSLEKARAFAARAFITASVQ